MGAASAVGLVVVGQRGAVSARDWPGATEGGETGPVRSTSALLLAHAVHVSSDGVDDILLLATLLSGRWGCQEGRSTYFGEYTHCRNMYSIPRFQEHHMPYFLAWKK